MKTKINVVKQGDGADATKVHITRDETYILQPPDVRMRRFTPWAHYVDEMGPIDDDHALFANAEPVVSTFNPVIDLTESPVTDNEDELPPLIDELAVAELRRCLVNMDEMGPIHDDHALVAKAEPADPVIDLTESPETEPDNEDGMPPLIDELAVAELRRCLREQISIRQRDRVNHLHNSEATRSPETFHATASSETFDAPSTARHYTINIVCTIDGYRSHV